MLHVKVNLRPPTDLLDAVDVGTEITLRLRRAEGMAQVCLSAMDYDTLWEQELQHALGLLHSYLAALRQGMARWREETLPAPSDPATSIDA